MRLRRVLLGFFSWGLEDGRNFRLVVIDLFVGIVTVFLSFGWISLFNEMVLGVMNDRTD